MTDPLDIVVLGLTITSSWGNGHATTYRALLQALAQRGHQVTFLERDVPWYRDNRDLPHPSFCDTILYQDLHQLKREHRRLIRRADIVMVGSCVPEGVAVGRWVCSQALATAFYDIDTPVTLHKLQAGDYEYLHPDLIRRYDIYFSVTGGPTLQRLEQVYGSPCARALCCSVDPQAYYPEETDPQYDLGYLGTYSADRQPALDKLLVTSARQWQGGRFVVAGPQYPTSVRWPANVKRIDHIPPCAHRRFYNSQRFTLNVARADLGAAGYSPSARLFEAAACGAAIISDSWPGLETFFTPGEEILVCHTADEVLACLRDPQDKRRRAVADRARRRVLQSHTAGHRAQEFEEHVAPLAFPRESLSVVSNPSLCEGEPPWIRQCSTSSIL